MLELTSYDRFSISDQLIVCVETTMDLSHLVGQTVKVDGQPMLVQEVQPVKDWLGRRPHQYWGMKVQNV